MSSSITTTTPTILTPRQAIDLGTTLQRRLSFATATLTKEDATLLGGRPHLFDEWALTWLRFRAHGVKVFVDCSVDCKPERLEAVHRVLETTPGVYTVGDQDRATLIIVDNDKRLAEFLCSDADRADAFFVFIGSAHASPWVLKTVAPDDIENGLSAFFKWLRYTLPDPTREY